MEKTLFSRGELAERWGCSSRYVEELERNGILKRVNLSKVLYPIGQIRDIEESEKPSPTLEMVRELKSNNKKLLSENICLKKSLAELSKIIYGGSYEKKWKV